MVAQVAAGGAALFGAILLLEHAYRANDSVGNLLFSASLAATGLPNPGRPSIATSLIFVTLGLGLLLIDVEWRGRVRPSQWLALVTVLLGLIGFEGYLFNMDALFRFAVYSTMAVHTSILAMVLGMGLLHARPDRGLMATVTSEDSGGVMARRLLPVAVFLPLVLAWPRLHGELLGLYETEVGLAIFATSNMVAFTVVIWLSARSLNQLDAARRAADRSTREALTQLEASHAQLQQEIAERNRAEAEARASEERFSVAFEASPAGLALSHMPSRVFVSVNGSFQAITGLTNEQIIGRRIDELEIVDADVVAEMRARLETEGVARNVLVRFRTPVGEEQHALVSIQPVTVQGEPHLLTTMVDITARVRAETELRASNQQLESTLAELRSAQQQIIEQERIAALGQLASGIAHDFNNALGPILGYSDLLLEEPRLLENVEESLEYVRAINVAAQGAAGVVMRLRDFYRRRQSGEVLGPAHLPDLIAQAISLTRPRWKDQAQANGATIDVVAEVREVPPIDGNPGELRDGLVNLIINAVDALPAGGTITIRTRSEGEQVVVEVVDDGIGMTEDVRRQCLQPFFTTKGERGTGLGLDIVHGMVRRHGGTIEIESAPEQGTTLRLRLPARLTPVPEPRTPHTTDGVRRSLRVLLVDDEPLMRQAVAHFLAIDDHLVDVASTGREAAPKLEAISFDLVITDRAMPEMGGDELALLVKHVQPSTPVLMLTGFGDLMEASGEQPPGVDLVLPKPTTLSRLRVAVASLVPDHGRSRPQR
jgi:PAS domain S-box-containing protein